MNWIGAILLISCAYFCGASLANKEGERLDALDSLISLLGYMRRRMQGERVPLFRVFVGYEDAFLDKYDFLSNLRSCRNGMDSVWREGVKLLPLSEGIAKELVIFGESMGRLPLEEQLKRIDVCVSALEAERAYLGSELPKKQKSMKTLWLLMGGLTAIILL